MRHRYHRERRRTRRPIHEPALPVGRVDGGREGEQQGEQLTAHQELQRHRQSFGDEIGHRDVASDRPSEVAGSRVAEPSDITLVHRFVEVETLVQRLDLLGIGVLPDDRVGGLPRHQFQHGGDGERHGEQDEEQVRQPARHVPHGSRPVSVQLIAGQNRRDRRGSSRASPGRSPHAPASVRGW